jgi:hypothetical protein
VPPPNHSFSPDARSPEQALLLACAATVPNPDTVRGAAAAVHDWPCCLDACRRHRLIPITFDRLSSHAPDLVPPQTLGQLRQFVFHNTAAALLLLEALGIVLRRFAADGIPVLVFKGPLLAEQLYASSTRRESFDLDLLVAPDQFARARQSLTDLGFAPSPALGPAQESAHLAQRRCLLFQRQAPAHPVPVELHTATLPRYFPGGMTYADLEPASRTVRCDDIDARVPGPEDLLLLLCQHGTRHQWASLSLVADVAQTLRGFPDLDAQAVVAAAQSRGSLRSLGVGCSLAAGLLGAPLPAPLQAPSAERRTPHSQRHAAWPACLAACRQRLFAPAPHAIHPLRLSLFHLRLLDRAADRCRYLNDVLLTPGTADWTAWPLPRRLHWLYPLLRPLRLLARYGGEAG